MYLDPISNEYSQEFYEWYETSGVGDLFGNLAYFTKHASASELIEYVATKSRTPGEKINELLASMGAL